MLKIFWQVLIGAKKDYQNANKIKIKRNSKQWNLWRILDFKYLNFFEVKNYSFAEFFDKIWDPYNKTTQIL